MGHPAIFTVPRLFAVLLIPAWLAGCSPTATYGTGEAPEMAVFREVTGGILSHDKDAPIEYQPRAPLVVPPNARELPPPADTASAESPDWPIDPNERIASMEGREREDPRYGGSQAEYRRLRPLAGMFPERLESTSTGSPYDIVHSKQQQEEFRKAVAEAKGYGRKKRRFLTEPPDTYREPAATAPAEFEDINTSGGGGGWWRWLRGGR